MEARRRDLEGCRLVAGARLLALALTHEKGHGKMKIYMGIPLWVLREYKRSGRWLGAEYCTHDYSCCREYCEYCSDIRDQIDNRDREIPPLAIFAPYCFAAKQRRDGSRAKANKRRYEIREYRSNKKRQMSNGLAQQ